jgi:DNA ligase-1
MSNAVEVLFKIKNQEGNIEKANILAKHKDDVTVKMLLNLAYNPYFTYGIKKLIRPLVKFAPAGSDPKIIEFMRVCNTLNTESTTNEHLELVQNFLESVDLVTQQIYQGIITKSLSIGMAAKSINKVIPNLIPIFECMLADAVDLETLEYPVLLQEKMDGVRCIIIKKDGNTTLFTRQGNEIPSKRIKEAIDALTYTDFVLDGELLLKGKLRKSTSGKINSLMKSGYNKEIDDNLEYYIFDYLTLEEWVANNSLISCFNRTTEVLGFIEVLGEPFNAPKTTYAYAEEDLYKFYKEIREQNGEGIIIKTDSPYVWKRTKAWGKLKAICSATLEIVGTTDGVGKNLGKVGSVTCKSSDGLLVVNVNPRSDDDRNWFTENRNRVAGLKAEVLFNEIITNDTDDKFSLFLPRFAESWSRFDKSSADSLEKIKKESNNG